MKREKLETMTVAALKQRQETLKARLAKKKKAFDDLYRYTGWYGKDRERRERVMEELDDEIFLIHEIIDAKS